MVLSSSTNDMQTLIPSHHLTRHWTNLQTAKSFILKTEVSSEMCIGRIGRIGFDFKNTGFIFLYVSERHLIAFDVGF